MKRRLLNLLTAASLLLCVAACVLWVRSYWVQDTFEWNANNVYTEPPPDTEAPQAVAETLPESAPAKSSEPEQQPSAAQRWLEEGGPIWADVRRIVTARGGMQLHRRRVELGGFSGSAGRPGFSHESEPFDPADPRSLAYPVSGPAGVGRWLDWSALGFEAVAAEEGSWKTAWAGTDRTADWSVTVPLWAVALAFAVRPAWCAAAWHRSARRRPGHCGKCGYDLTANVSGVCPECGRRTA